MDCNRDHFPQVIADLGGIKEISQALGVTPAVIRRWIGKRNRINCPRPVLKLDMGHVYSIQEWRSWAAWWYRVRYERKEQP